jgi:transglutaminase-like putative cysteine protease
MTTRDISAVFSPPREHSPTDWEYRVPEWFERFTPAQRWDTYLLLLLSFGTVAWTVRDANWVDTPGIIMLVFVGTLVGLAFAKLKVPWPVLHLGAVVLGALLVTWQASTLTEGDSLSDRLGELWPRLELFYEAATTGGISTDLMPISLVVLGGTWLLGYFGAWFLFRRNNVWPGLFFAGLTMLTGLSFLPDRYLTNFLVFTFLAMMLVARVTMIQRREQWRVARVATFGISRWLTVRATVIFSIGVLLLGAIVPLRLYRSDVAVYFWDLGRTPISFLEEDFSRLLAAIPSREDQMGRFFGTSLPFVGKIKFEGEVVFWTESAEPNYWLSRTYSEYTSQGWFAGVTKKRRIGPDSDQPPAQESEERELTAQTLQFSFDTNRLLSGGNIDWISREAVIETLAPLRFQIDMRSDRQDSNFPEEIRLLAQEMRETFGLPVTSFVESRITRMLPEDLILVRVAYTRDDENKTYVRAVHLARPDPEFPDVVSWRFTERLEANDSYEMNSFVSQATLEDLRAAGTEYEGFIRDHYLQLPASMPQRVRDMAAELTQDADTPLDKALAIKEYLRGGTFTYSQDIDKPPRGSDGVDNFLFETKEGYSDYFASAMTILLRSAGVPARMAAGYASGEFEAGSTRRAVKDSDSHGWSQVYFPEHGWIDFEPTPNWPGTGLVGGDPAGSNASALLPPSDFQQTPFDCLRPEDLLDGFAMVVSYHPHQQGQQAQAAGFAQEVDPCDELLFGSQDGLAILPGDSVLVDVIIAVGIVLGLLGILAIGTVVAWRRRLGDLPGERAYVKMSRLGTLAGVRRQAHQTPLEYSKSVGRAVPRTAAGAQALGWAFALGRYGREGVGEDGIDAAWKSVRAWLLLRALRRLVPIGNA